MAAIGKYGQMALGSDGISRVFIGWICSNGSVNTYAIPGIDNCWAARFRATSTKDIKSVKVSWGTVTAAGTVNLRVEGITVATGKPDGTPYDANATKDFTPSTTTPWQTITFDTPPSTGLVVGTEYAVLLRTTVAGTAHTLRSDVTVTTLPTVCLQGATLAGIAEVAGRAPLCILVFEDDTEECMGMCPFHAYGYYDLYGTRAAGAKLIVGTGETIKVSGVGLYRMAKVTTPTGDLRIRILDSAGTLVTGSTITLNKISLANLTVSRPIRAYYGTPLELTASGSPYRIVADSTDSGSGACWRFPYATAESSAHVPSGFYYTYSSDGSAFTDDTASQPAVEVVIDDITASAAGGGLPMFGGSIVR